MLLTFLDSHCTPLCPIEGALLAGVQRAPPADVQEVILIVSANPQDTPTSVRSAARRWGWTPGSWQWLLGDADELAPIWRSYGVDVRPAADDVLHSGALYVIDQAGNQRAGYGVPFEPQHVAQLVRSLRSPPPLQGS